MPPVLHQWAFVDLLEQLHELVLLVVFLEAVAGVDGVVVVADLGGVEHQQLLGVVAVQLLDLLRQRHLVYYLVVHHLLVAGEEVYYRPLYAQLVTVGVLLYLLGQLPPDLGLGLEV